MLKPDHEIPLTASLHHSGVFTDMNANRLSRGLVLASWGASLLACLLRMHTFLSTVIVHDIIFLGTSISFGVLTLVRGDDWIVFTSSSVVLCSMIGQVRVCQSTSPFITDEMKPGLLESRHLAC